MNTPTIVDLRLAPHHFDIVTDRIWRAWWAADGDPIDQLQSALREVIATERFPFTLVATADDRFLGTVTAIADDIAERPTLGPCIAALWVEPDARGQSVAQALIEAAMTRLSACGYRKVYLAAKPHLHDYYAQRGWTKIEVDVGTDRLDIFTRALP